MNSTFKSVTDFAKNVVETLYTERNIDDFIGYLANDVSWIGPGENEFYTDKTKINEYFYKGKEHVQNCTIEKMDFKIVHEVDEECIVMGKYIVRTDESTGMMVETFQRATTCIVIEEGQLKIKHMHISNHYSEMKSTEFLPGAIGEQSYNYLHRTLAEKTEVIEMINNNIEGGLKGSNDDENYSYYYVNDGLPNMLGYTHDEFMEMSGGTALGAVYPPDLQNALNDVVECFKIGPTYSTQYRMRKKDGSLLWVIDRGKKTIGIDGKVRINSIITDITKFKNALHELEIEKEKYRIVLENIREIMFEYDINEDMFVLYDPFKNNGVQELRKVVITDFIRKVKIEGKIHKDDIEKSIEMLRSGSTHVIEIRGRINRHSQWRWLRIQCRPIVNKEKQIIHLVGSIKDFTKEKQTVEKLTDLAQKDSLTGILNKATAKKQVTDYMQENEDNGGAMILLDIDDFKMVNDTMGHLKGDQVLIGVSNIIRSFVRDGDVVGRMGGDEFVIFIKTSDKKIVKKRIITIQTEIKRIKIDKTNNVKCSMGISYFSKGLTTFEQLFKRADEALYMAKNNGKNQVCTYNES